jgi:catechol 2,3-dioxygenase-like lactoylglutathione lyase family enzyme
VSEIAFDHIHLISEDPKAAARWYATMFGGQITAESEVRGAPQISVAVSGATILIRGKRPGEVPQRTPPMQAFDGYSSHNEWGIDHFGFTYAGDLIAFCDDLQRKGAELLVEPWEFTAGLVICYVAAPDGVSIEVVQARSSD